MRPETEDRQEWESLWFSVPTSALLSLLCCQVVAVIPNAQGPSVGTWL